MSNLFSKEQIDELTEKFPRGSQEGKGLDALVSYKIQYPDKRGNLEGYWYVTEASRVGDDVVFHGVFTHLVGMMEDDFKLSTLEGIVEKGYTIEVVEDFKPAKLRELMDEAPLRLYIRKAQINERRAEIMGRRDEIHETVFNLFKPLEPDGKTARLIADEMTDRVISQMLGFKKRELLPAIIHALAQWLKLERPGA